jgi:soluble lytic murein transglycosylase-like protein
MSIRRLRKESLLLAGFVVLVVAFAFQQSNAEMPMPEPKPQRVIDIEPTSSVVPVPDHKPEAEIIPVSQPVMVIKEKIDLPALKSSQLVLNAFPDRQARLYREIFELQDAGKMKEADQKIEQISNPVLLGHVYAQRYLHPKHYKASYAELSQWMSVYADHPQAEQIYNLALSRQPAGLSKPLTIPVKKKYIRGNLAAAARQGKIYKSKKKRSVSENNRVMKLRQDISRHVERYEPTLALNILNNDYALQFMDDVEYDRLRALIAAGYLYAGKLEKADKLASASLKRSGAYAPKAGWVKGLVSWQNGNYRDAARAFETAASSPYATGWMVSAAGYWASRSHMRAGNVELVSKWLELSATYPRTFYGLIATRALGYDTDFDWYLPTLNRSHVKFIHSTKEGQRAAALLKVNRPDLAEAELYNIPVQGSVEKQEALLAYAHHYNLAALSIRLGNAFTNKGGFYDAALYPVPSWQPVKGYRVSPALIHAIVRQESRFNVMAQNPSGATGLMQLMPATANYIAGNSIYEEAGGRYELRKPEVNLEIGQTYVERLLGHRAVGNDLLSLAIAYNAGPGRLSRWKSEREHIHDPLMFIESIPYKETRAFVERVLSNYWIYQMRMNEKPESLDAVAEGKWARYAGRGANGTEDSRMASR